MSLHIYISHTGERLVADPVSFASPDALRTWISRKVSIPPQRQILMTARGKNVRPQTLATENEIFVYDRLYIGGNTVRNLPEIPAPDPFTPENPPDTLDDQNDLQAWRNLYMARRSWALKLATQCGPINKAIDIQIEHTHTINRAVDAALQNLKAHVGTLEHKFQDAQAWANGLLKEQQLALDGWRNAVSNIETIPATKDFTFLRRSTTPKMAKERQTGTLQDYIDVDQVKRAASQVPTISQRLARHIDEVEKAVHALASETETLVETSHPSPQESASNHLEELETIAKKITSDYEHILALPNTQKTLSGISRMALNHTKDLLPSMMEISIEIQTSLEQAVKKRNLAMRSAVSRMQTISGVEARISDISNAIASMDVEGDVFDTLFEAFHLPVVYGSVLLESVRRGEWSDKMKTDSLSIAEELAVFRDEEQRRRKKWAKGLGDYLSLTDDSTPGVEVNLQGGQGLEWPEVSRKEVEIYIESLRAKPDTNSSVQELTQLFKDLDAPTKQQRRKSKAFKQGSIFDMGRSSFLMRGDDMVRSLKDEKTKLEDRLKGSESRIRKLEDLLHRQSQMSRPVSANFGTEIPISPASPRPDALSRRSSVSSRRMSSNQPPEDKALVQRIVTLEAELVAERELVSKLQKESLVERQSSSDKIQEVQSTNEDLMGNLEGMRRDFEDERKFLKSQAKDLQMKLEDVEEELDKVIHARETEKLDFDERLQTELDTVKLKNDEEIACLKSEVETHKGTLEKDNAQNTALQNRLNELEQSEKDHINALQATHVHLSPGGAAPEDLTALVKAIEILAEGLAIHAKGSDEAAAKASEENKSLTEKLELAEVEAKELRTSLEGDQTERSRLQSLLGEEKLKLSAVKTELEDERKQLNTLRSRFSAGETGSEVLKERVVEEERKVATLSEKLVVAESRAQNFEEEIRTWQKKTKELEEAGERTSSRLNAKGVWAKELSEKLYSHVDQLSRILQQLGFTIVRQDDTMVIQRASKVNNSSALLGESVGPPGSILSIQDPKAVLWMDTKDPEEEKSNYTAFIAAIEKFNVDIFGEAVVKRVKDIETLARKWQKEARGYREKSHRAQSESHEKIAYRSFKEGDLALFLPTRNQAIRSWAAFNVGAPHYFLREQDAHKLHTRDWLLARISKVEERVVDLSKSMNGTNPDRRSVGEVSDGASFDDDNPFELSDGLRWYLLDASEEKPGAPSTPGLAKSTVASAHVDARGSIRLKRASNGGGATKTLTKSLDSRRNSSGSRMGPPVPTLQPTESAGDNVLPAEGDTGAQARREEAPIFDEVRRDLLSGPSNGD
ncbi:oligomeric, coiled-coil, peripheral membrane protein [Onygenales sp. PD_40]|nr:oligomeric, coiled-coil, peripheral membrane protein [Onygenales sp. PD_40]KAK2784423.1 oligomeric, coiled-coil, peripheral membrane protein [Onygenales sp. PD_12]KAK2786843.1 oligomeric, coiled-coil, peripheral membrane protein [Onygenales sp. PD_10]